MPKNTTTEQSRSITCRHCDAPAMASFGPVVRTNDNGPVEVLYKCWTYEAFYIAKKVTCWGVEK